MRADKKSRANFVLKIANATADRGFLNLQGARRCAKTAGTGSRNNIAKMTQLH